MTHTVIAVVVFLRLGSGAAFGASKKKIAREIERTDSAVATLFDERRRDRAPRLAKQVVEATGKRYGPNHRSVYRRLSNLAALCFESGNLKKAETLGRQVYEESAQRPRSYRGCTVGGPFVLYPHSSTVPH